MFNIDYSSNNSGLPIVLGIGFCLILSGMAVFLTFLFFNTMCTCLDEDEKKKLMKEISERKRIDKILEMDNMKYMKREDNE